MTTALKTPPEGDDRHETHVAVNIENKGMDAGAHIWRVLATFLGIGSLISLMWALSQYGLLEPVATAASAGLTLMFHFLVRRKFVVLPNRTSDDERIEEGKSAIRSIAGMVSAFIDRVSLGVLFLICCLYGVFFLFLRWGIALGLGVFTNFFVALAAGLALASLICFPTLYVGITRLLKTKDPNEYHHNA